MDLGPSSVLARLRLRLRRKSTWFVGVPVLLVVSGYGVGAGYNAYLNSKTPPPLSFGDTLGGGTSEVAPQDSAASPVAGRPAPVTTAAPGKAAPVVATPKAATAPRTATKPRTGTAPGASSAPVATSPVEGTWKIASGSVAGYRVGYSSPVGGGTRVGRSEAVTGQMTIKGSTVRTTTVSVDFRELTSDGGSTCDEHVREIMDTANHPFESLRLGTPIELGSVPPDGKQVSVKVTAQVTLRGVTRSETFTLTARRNASRIEVLGSVPVNRDDYKIPDSDKPGFTIDKKGTIEVLLAFERTR